MRLILQRFALATTLLFAAFSAAAHHSTAIYDPDRNITLAGVVVGFHWSSPHVYIDVAAAQESDETVIWSVEAGSPQLLSTSGWSSTSLTPGDRVVAIATPSRDPDSRTALLRSISKTDGTQLGVPGDPSDLVAVVGLTSAQSSCPRIDVTLVEPSASAETRPVKLGEESIFVKRSGITTTSDISEIRVAGDDALTSIQIKYVPEAAARLYAATTNSDGLRIAFVVDDEVWLAFTLEGPYGMGSDGVQLSLQNGMTRAQRLIESIRECTGDNGP